MHSQPLASRLLAGAGGGIAATFGMYGMRTATQRWLPHTVPPMNQDPGAFVVDRAKSALPDEARDRVEGGAVETAASSLSHFVYGATAAAGYAALRRGQPDILRDGLVLGIGVWAVGYLGWLPRTGLMPDIRTHRPAQVVMPLLQHAVFGVLAVASCAWLRRRLG